MCFVAAPYTQPSTWTVLKTRTSTQEFRMTARYIDNIFIIYTSSEAILNNFLTNLNINHTTINMTTKSLHIQSYFRHPTLYQQEQTTTNNIPHKTYQHPAIFNTELLNFNISMTAFPTHKKLDWEVSAQMMTT